MLGPGFGVCFFGVLVCGACVTGVAGFEGPWLALGPCSDEVGTNALSSPLFGSSIGCDAAFEPQPMARKPVRERIPRTVFKRFIVETVRWQEKWRTTPDAVASRPSGRHAANAG
jgi:hypothetical protein